MYEGYNCGEKIKWVAKLVATIGIICSWVIAIIVFGVIVDEFDLAFAPILIGALVGLCLMAVSWINGLVLYSFGELVSCAIDLRKNSLIEKTKAGEKNPTVGVGKAQAHQAGVKADNNRLRTPIHEWDCAFCGHHNTESTLWCEQCGLQGNLHE